MGQLALTGTITAGPSGSAAFPAFAAQVPLSLRGNSSFSACTGVLERNLTSPGGPTTLDGVGSGKTVTKGTFLYMRTGGDLLVTLTVGDGLGGAGTVDLVVPLSGLLVLEFTSPSRELVGLAAQGTAGVEYLVAGAE